MGETVTKPVSTASEIAAMNPGEYVEAVQRRWNFAERLVNTVNEGVESRDLTPLEGAKLSACITGEIFDHGVFHGNILSLAPAELLQYAKEIMGGDTQRTR